MRSPIGRSVSLPKPAIAQPPLAHRLAGLLLTDAVQGIDFRFGHIKVMPAGYRIVAEALFQGRIWIDVNAAELEQHTLPGGAPIAMYDAWNNRIVVSHHNMMENDEDIVTLFHEATHAVQDRMKQVISAVQDEGAAQVAEVWFRKASNMSLQTKNEIVLEVGLSMHARRGSQVPVIATEGEIYRMNYVVRTVGGIQDGALTMDGL